MPYPRVKPPPWKWHPASAAGDRALLDKLCLVAPVWPGVDVFAVPGGAHAHQDSWQAFEMTRTPFGLATLPYAYNLGGQAKVLWRRGAERLSGATGLTIIYLGSPGTGGVAYENWAFLGRGDSGEVTAKIQIGSAALKLQGHIETAAVNLSTADTGTLTQDAWYFCVLRWQSGDYLRLDLYNLDGSVGPAAGVSLSTLSSTLLADTVNQYKYGGPHHRCGLMYVAPTRLTDTDVRRILRDPFQFLYPANTGDGEGTPRRYAINAGSGLFTLTGKAATLTKYGETTQTRFYFSGPGGLPNGDGKFGSGWKSVYDQAVGYSNGFGLGRDRTIPGDDWWPHITTSPGHAAGDMVGRLLYVSEPFAGSGTFSGTVKGRMRCVERESGANLNLGIAVRIVSNDGQTIRGTALAPTAGNATGGSAPEAFLDAGLTSAVNRQLPLNGALSLTPVAYSQGDRIQVEVGARFQVADTPGGSYYGRLAASEWYDPNTTTDLPEDDTTATLKVPWVEFETPGALVFQADETHGDPLAGRLVEWTSDNHAVLADPPDDYTDALGQVQTPELTLIGAGTAHLQATCEGRVSNIVTIQAAVVGAVVSVTVTPTALSGYVGENGVLAAKCWDGPNGTGNEIIVPNDAIGWSMSDASVAAARVPGRGISMTFDYLKAGAADLRAWYGGIGSNTVVATVTARPGLQVGRVVLTPTTMAGQVGGQGAVTITVYSTGATLAERRTGFKNYLAGLNAGASSRVLIGQMMDGPGNVFNTDQATRIITQTSKAPAIFGVPVKWYTSTNNVTIALQALGQGYIVDMGAWWFNPQTGGSQSDTTITFHNLLVAGATRTAWFAALDAAAARFASIRDAGYFVIFRPFIELNGDWFWWGTPSHATAADFIAVWQEMWNYLMTTKGLADCLLWDFNVSAGWGNYTAAYPGDAYVDLVSIDYYGDYPGSGMAATYAALQAKPKPIRVAEFGCHSAAWDPPQPTFSYDNSQLITDIAASLPNVIAACVWSGQWGISWQNGAAALMNHAWSVTRDELPSFGEQVLEGRSPALGSSDPSVAYGTIP